MNREPRARRRVDQVRLIAAARAARAGTHISTTRGKEPPMGSTTDKIKGMANEAAGNIKQGLGKAMDDPKMQADGIMQERKGEAQQAVGKAKDKVKSVVDKV
jgi:uncharacterized protein YjbJ (UPF0337 family)